MRPALNRNFFIATMVMVAVFAATTYLDRPQQPKVMELAPPVSELPRNPAPDATFVALDGTQHPLAALKGRRVILNIWASWCAPCLAEMPQLLDLAQQNPDDLTLVLLSVDTDKDAIHRFFETHKFALPANALVAWDKDKTISKDMFGTVRYPETVLIDTQGRLAQKTSGAVDWTAPDMQKIIEGLR